MSNDLRLLSSSIRGSKARSVWEIEQFNIHESTESKFINIKCDMNIQEAKQMQTNQTKRE